MKISRDANFNAALSIVRELQGAGYIAFFAGGCVRDWLLSRKPKDIDIATSASPDEIIRRFPKSKPIGKAFGVVQVIIGDMSFEVATFRVDLSYKDGRRPEAIAFASPEEDAKRRDFGMNGLFYNPVEDKCIDFVGGLEDIWNQRLRAIGNPAQRFKEDYLRMLRAVRFAATLSFTIDPPTLSAIQTLAPRLAATSAERVTPELTQILIKSPRPGDGLRLLHQAGILNVILPEVCALIGQEQPPIFHPEGDVFTHTMMMLNEMLHPTPTLAYSVLLHDIAKPVTATVCIEPNGLERIRFNRHAHIGSEMSYDILLRLRMPNQHIGAITHCVRNHMKFMEVQHMKDSTLRKLIGAKTFPIELELHRLDCLCSNGNLENHTFLLHYIDAIQHKPVLPKRWISGHDIMHLGIESGPDVGHWLKIAYDAQLNEMFKNKTDLLAWLRDQTSPPEDSSVPTR